MHTNYKKNNQLKLVVRHAYKLQKEQSTKTGRPACAQIKKKQTKTGRPACTQITKKEQSPTTGRPACKRKRLKKKSTRTDDRQNGDRRRVDGSRVE
jgi:hypothetical protein